MIRKTIVVALSLALSLVLLGCAAGVSQEEYDAMVAEVNATQDEIAGLEAERDAAKDEITGLEAERDATKDKIAGLEAERDVAQAEAALLEVERNAAQAEAARLETEIEDLYALTAIQSVEEAWDRAKQRHKLIVQDIPFLDELEEMAPWIRFPDKPAWFDSARVCSIVLADDPAAYEAVCIVTTDTQQMLVRLSDFGTVTSMTCQGRSVDYEIIMTRDENGKIIQEMMRAGESLIVLDWTDTGVGEILTANVNGEVFEAPWSEEPEYLLGLFSDLADWLKTINMAGGLTEPVDQPLMIIALGELRQPPYVALSITWVEVFQRAVSDFCQGVPQTCM